MTHVVPKDESPLREKPVDTGFEGLSLYPGYLVEGEESV